MSGESNHLITDGKHKPEEIQPAERKIPSPSQEKEFNASVAKIAILGDDKQLLDELKASRDTEQRDTKDRKIQKVPEIMLRNRDFEEYFKPKELSIGPIHAADPMLFKKELKLKLAAVFVKATGKTEDYLFDQFKPEIGDMKKYFTAEVRKDYSDDELVRLVFLDGCAMIEFIHSYVEQRLNMFNISNGQAHLIQQDLFLLENQIPFRVLAKLLRLLKSPMLPYGCCLSTFVSMNSIVPKDPKEVKRFEWEIHNSIYSRGHSLWAGELDHFLDFYRKVIVISTRDSFSIFEEIKTIICFPFLVIFGALGALMCHAIDRFKRSSGDLPQYWRKMQSFRNVQELNAASIKFKTTDSLETVSFRSHLFVTGQVSLPTLVMDSSTAGTLLNMVAYEMCVAKQTYNNDQHVEESLGPEYPWVTSYVNLLDLLIDSEQDVKDLRAADIIRNVLSDDTEAAKLINSIGSYCFAPPVDTYVQVKYGIEKHYRRRVAIWTAQVCQAHFSSPLTVVALLAAMVVLVLTGIQTWYTINPKG